MSQLSAPLILAACLLTNVALPSGALAQKAGAAPLAADAKADLGRFCLNVAPSAEETRIAFQIARLGKLDEQVRQRLSELEKTEAETRDWVARREAMMKSGADNVVAIYSKMQPDTAATRIGAMEDAVAVAILAKLNPRAAGAILEQMDSERASKLSAVLSGAAAPEQKS